MMLPDWTYYSGTYKGQNAEAVFNAQLPQAAAYVSALIGLNSVTSSTEDAYKRAICAVCDAQATHGDGGSITIGAVSLGTDNRTLKEVSYDAAANELATTGLLFGGLA